VGGFDEQRVLPRLLSGLSDMLGFSMDTPWEELPAKVHKAVLHGSPDQVHVRYKNRYGRERSYYAAFEGVLPFLERRHEDTDSDFMRDKYEGLHARRALSVCHGTRLKPGDPRRQAQRPLDRRGHRPVDRRGRRVAGRAGARERERAIADRVLKEIQARLSFLVDVGLDYLSLDRPAATLAGGEAQRIRLATQIGSGLVGRAVRPRRALDRAAPARQPRLIETLVRLRDMGNTLIVVEHDEDTIKTADWVVDIGPAPASTAARCRQRHRRGPAGRRTRSPAYLLGGARSPCRPSAAAHDGRELTVVRRARAQPRASTCASRSGASSPSPAFGSGKSTLVNDILAAVLVKQLNGNREVPGGTPGSPASSTSTRWSASTSRRSAARRGPTRPPTPACSTHAQAVRETTEAKVRGYLPRPLQLQRQGRPLRGCSGDGTIKIEMNFLPDVYVPCEVCHGARYNRETLEVHFKGKSISEILDMPIEEAAEFFEAVPAIRRHLQTLVEVGLGYVRLGQPAPTLSGGEAQRVKLASELQKRQTGRTIYVLDEPTTGLHFEDINKLLGVLSASSTPATRSSSSSTTSTSSRRPTGSSTWARGRVRRRHRRRRGAAGVRRVGAGVAHRPVPGAAARPAAVEAAAAGPKKRATRKRAS
jgi:excinuclease ABC subunit A